MINTVTNVTPTTAAAPSIVLLSSSSLSQQPYKTNQSKQFEHQQQHQQQQKEHKVLKRSFNIPWMDAQHPSDFIVHDDFSSLNKLSGGYTASLGPWIPS